MNFMCKGTVVLLSRPFCPHTLFMLKLYIYLKFGRQIY